MSPTPRSDRSLSAKGLASSIAMALSLAGGTVLCTALAVSPAMARKKKEEKQAQPQLSEAFRKAIIPIQKVVNDPKADITTVDSQIPGLVAAANSNDEKWYAGNMILEVGNKENDNSKKLQAIQLMLDSGKVPQADYGKYSWYLGQLEYEAKNYDAARKALEAAVAAGFTEHDPAPLIAQSYYEQKDNASAVAYTLKQAKAEDAAGRKVSENMLLLALRAAYLDKMNDKILPISKQLVEDYPTKDNWAKSLQVIDITLELPDPAELDMLRLMRQTDSWNQHPQFVRYIELADPRIMSNEVYQVMKEGVAAGTLDPNSNYYKDVKGVVDSRMSEDQKDWPSSVTDAEKPSAPGHTALAVGDLLYSLAKYDKAEQMYALAMQKGGIDNSVAMTRMGICQVKQGKLDAAAATFAKVTGTEDPVAQMWGAYVETQQNASSAPAATAPAAGDQSGQSAQSGSAQSGQAAQSGS